MQTGDDRPRRRITKHSLRLFALIIPFLVWQTPVSVQREQPVATVTLDAFSGRPNPEWTLSPQEERELESRLAKLPLATTRHQSPPGLGYRGLVVRYEDQRRELRAYGGQIATSGATLDDPGRTVERWLLETGRSVLDSGLADDIAREIERP